MKIGYIGLGNMGKGMVLNLIKNKHDVFVWSRTSEKVIEMEKKGAIGCSSPNEVSSKADFVMACLVDEEVSISVFLEEYALIKNAREEQIFVDHGTVSPLLSKRMYECALENKAHFLDAPVSGGPEGSANGTLAIMVGGDNRPFQTTKPVFDSMGKTVLHMGPSGSGSVTKLVNQVLVGVNGMASCEAFLLGIKSGVDGDKLWKVLQGAWGGSKMVDRNAPYIIEKNFGPSQAPIRNMYKDMRIIMEVANELNVSLPTAKKATEVFNHCKDIGLNSEDLTVLYKLMETNEV